MEKLMAQAAINEMQTINGVFMQRILDLVVDGAQLRARIAELEKEKESLKKKTTG